MFKTWDKFVGIVEVLGMVCVAFGRLFTIVEFSAAVAVGKTAGFKQAFSNLFRVVTHKLFCASLSVNKLVFPGFHKTYNNLLLFNKLNYRNWRIA